MKRQQNVIWGFIAFVVSLGMAFAHGNPRETAEVAVDGNAVSVEYGRPALKGRTVDALLGRLKPGGVWRLGADKSTTFTTAADLAFANGTNVASGAYSISAKKGTGDSWTLVFKQTDQDDTIEVPLVGSEAADSAELLTIGLAEADGGAVLTIQWGQMSLATKFKAN